MRRVIVESPYAGEVERNKRYLARCLLDSLDRGEAPIASHGLFAFSSVLDDATEVERELGIQAGLAWHDAAQLIVFYVDYGWSKGMLRAKHHAGHHSTEVRRIGENPQ